MKVEELHIGDIVSNTYTSTSDILLQIVELNVLRGVVKCIPINADINSWPSGVTNDDGFWGYSIGYIDEIVGTIAPISVEELL